MFLLCSSDPKKRFELFLKATQMDVIIEKLNMCNEHILKAKSQMDMQSKLAESLKKKRDEALKKLERFQSVANLRVRNLNYCIVQFLNKI